MGTVTPQYGALLSAGVFLDTYQRANETPLGAPYVQDAGNKLNLSSHQIVNTADPTNHSANINFGHLTQDYLEVGTSFTWAANGVNGMFSGVLIGDGVANYDYWAFGQIAGSPFIQGGNQAGTITAQAAVTITIGATHTIRLTRNGTAWTGYYDGALIFSWTDTLRSMAAAQIDVNLCTIQQLKIVGPGLPAVPIL